MRSSSSSVPHMHCGIHEQSHLVLSHAGAVLVFVAMVGAERNFRRPFDHLLSTPVAPPLRARSPLASSFGREPATRTSFVHTTVQKHTSPEMIKKGA